MGHSLIMIRNLRGMDHGIQTVLARTDHLIGIRTNHHIDRGVHGVRVMEETDPVRGIGTILMSMDGGHGITADGPAVIWVRTVGTGTGEAMVSTVGTAVAIIGTVGIGGVEVHDILARMVRTRHEFAVGTSCGSARSAWRTWLATLRSCSVCTTMHPS